MEPLGPAVARHLAASVRLATDLSAAVPAPPFPRVAAPEVPVPEVPLPSPVVEAAPPPPAVDEIPWLTGWAEPEDLAPPAAPSPADDMDDADDDADEPIGLAWAEGATRSPSGDPDAEAEPTAAAPAHSAPVLLDEVAARLEQIARTLRERRPAEIFAEGAADPLEVLITGYALGYTEAARHARQRADDPPGIG